MCRTCLGRLQGCCRSWSVIGCTTRQRTHGNDLLTTNAGLTASVRSLKDTYLETRNELGRTNGKFKKVNNMNKTLAAICCAAKGERMKDNGVHDNVNIGRERRHKCQAGTRLVPSVRQPTVGKYKRMSLTWKNGDIRKGFPCFEVFFNWRGLLRPCSTCD